MLIMPASIISLPTIYRTQTSINPTRTNQGPWKTAYQKPTMAAGPQENLQGSCTLTIWAKGDGPHRRCRRTIEGHLHICTHMAARWRGDLMTQDKVHGFCEHLCFTIHAKFQSGKGPLLWDPPIPPSLTHFHLPQSWQLPLQPNLFHLVMIRWYRDGMDGERGYSNTRELIPLPVVLPCPWCWKYLKGSIRHVHQCVGVLLGIGKVSFAKREVGAMCSEDAPRTGTAIKHRKIKNKNKMDSQHILWAYYFPQ